MSLIVDNLFGGLIDRLTDLINEAATAGRDLEIEAGEQARRTIEYARAAFAENLNASVNTLDQTSQGIITRIEQLANGVINKQQDVIANARRDTQQIVTSIFQTIAPGRLIPQLTTAKPRFILSNQETVHFIFDGLFAQVHDPNLRPTLTFGTTDYHPVRTHTQRLEFDVPKNDIFPAGGNPDRINSSTIGELKVPFRAPQAGIIRNAPGETAIYRVFVRSLPPSIGPVTWKWETTHSRHESRYREQGRYAMRVTGHSNGPHPDPALYQQLYNEDWHVCSCSNGDCESTNGHKPANPAFRGTNSNVNDRSLTAYPSPGWTIQPRSSQIHLEILQGTDYSHTRDPGTENPHQVTYLVSTQHHGSAKLFGNKTSDAVNVNIGFTEERSWTELESGNETITMIWGDSRARSILNTCNHLCQAGRCISSWGVTHVDIRGVTREYQVGSTVQNPYLTIQAGGRNVTLNATSTDQLPEIL